VANDGITVVYGENGVGKSGYGRLFNNVFYSRGDSFLIGNVFGPKRNNPITADLEVIDSNGKTHSLKYPECKSHPACQQFSCFDSKSVNVHIDNQNELHIQPKGLDFFEDLIQMIKLISDQIDTLMNQRKTENHFTKLFVENSQVKTKISLLSFSTNPKDLTDLALISETDKNKLVELEKQKNLLSISELEKNKKRLHAIKLRAADLKESIASLATRFTKEKIEFIAKAIDRYEELKAEVAKNGVEQFSDSHFKGIGSDEWQQFLKSGHDLNLLDHTEHGGHPKTDDLCPYCRQTLTDRL